MAGITKENPRRPPRSMVLHLNISPFNLEINGHYFKFDKLILEDLADRV
jgi:hypothetical protein